VIRAVETPDISVVLPIRNGMPHLVRTLEALRAQTYTNFTLFVQDALSTDGSLEYLRAFDGPFRIDIVSEADGTLTKGYNRAIGRATGDLVVPTACDEAMLPHAMETYVKWHREHPEAVFVYGGSRLIDADGETIRDVHPHAFDLIDYLRYAPYSCPTQMGFYNRCLLGDELYFDERLATVPDSEFVTRWALKFGQGRIVAKHDVTSTARADATSASYRPEGLADHVRDKTTVLERLLHGELKTLFMAHLERDLRFRLLNQYADHAYAIEGDGPIFHGFAVQAEAQISGHELNQALATKSRHLDWDGATRGLTLRPRVAPPAPPLEARHALTIEPGDMSANPYWKGTGAAVQPAVEGVLIKAPPRPWHYAARAPIDFSSVDFAAEFCWLRVQMSDVTQPLLLSLFDEDANQIFYEWTMPAGAGVQTLTVEVPRPVGAYLLVRTGAQATDAQGVFVKAEVLASS
jgi:glycosyltransferase involved in cell wall biosynthesis